MNIAEAKLALYAVSVSIFSVLRIPEAQASILIALMILDWLTGFLKSYCNGTTSSKKGIKGVLKKGIVFAIPVAVGHLVAGLGIDDFVVAASFSALIVYEFISVMSNVYSIRTGTDLPEYDVVSKLIKWLISFASKALDIPLGKVKDSSCFDESQRKKHR